MLVMLVVPVVPWQGTVSWEGAERVAWPASIPYNISVAG